MYCKWCGMDSKDDKRCDWCGRPFAAESGEQATSRMPPKTAGIPEATTAIPQATTAMTPADEDDPAMLPYNPRLAPVKRMQVEVVELPPIGVRLEKYLSIMTLLLAGGLVGAHYLPNIWYVPFFVLLFISGLLMGTFRVIGYYDDEFTDVLLVLVVTAFVGPVYATGIYLLFCVLKRDMNTSMMSLLASYLVLRMAIGTAAHGLADTITCMLAYTVALDIIMWVIQLLPLCPLFAGWMFASFTRPLNE